MIGTPNPAYEAPANPSRARGVGPPPMVPEPYTPPTLTTAVPPPSVTERTAPKTTTFNLTGASGKVPLGYGRIRTTGQVLYGFAHGNDLYYVLGFLKGDDSRTTTGPIDSLAGVYMSQTPTTSIGSGDHFVSADGSLEVWFKHGTLTQTVDATLAGLDTSWNEDMIVRDPSTGLKLYGVCYGIVRLIEVSTHWSDFPALTFEIKGRQVLDSRTSTVAYTENAVLQFYDWMRDPDGKALLAARINTAKINTAANTADELLGGKIRYAAHVLLSEAANVTDWEQTWKLLCDARFWYFAQNQWHLVLDRPASPAGSYDDSAVALDPAPTGEREDPWNRINDVAIEWTDVSAGWVKRTDRKSAAGVTPGTRKTATYRLPWIHDYARVDRLLTYLLNSYVYDGTLKVRRGPTTVGQMVGDVFTQSLAARGIGAQTWMLGSRTKATDGPWFDDVLIEYNAAKYSDSTATAPARTASTLLDPTTTTPDVTGFNSGAITEELYQDKVGVWQSRARLTWTYPSNYPWLDVVELYVSVNGGEYRYVDEYAGNAGGTGVALYNDVMELGVPYSFKLVVRSKPTIGVRRSAGVIASKTFSGKTSNPSDVLNLTAGANNGHVYLWWQPASDRDIQRYEIRKGTSTDTWSTAAYAGQTDVTHWQDPANYSAPVRYFVKASDGIRYSGNAAIFDVTLNALGTVVSESFYALVPDGTFTQTVPGLFVGSGNLILEQASVYVAQTVPLGNDWNGPQAAQCAMLVRNTGSPASAETERAAGSYASVGAWATNVDDPRRGGAPLWAPLPTNASGEIWGTVFSVGTGRLREHRARFISLAHSGNDVPTSISLAQPFFLDTSTPTVKQYGGVYSAPGGVQNVGMGVRLSTNDIYYQQVVSTKNVLTAANQNLLDLWAVASDVRQYTITTGVATSDVSGLATVAFTYAAMAGRTFPANYVVTAVPGASSGCSVVIDHLDATAQTVRFKVRDSTGAAASGIAFIYTIADNGGPFFFIAGVP